MQATRTPPGRAPAANPRHQSTQPPPAPSPAGPGTQIPAMRSEDEFSSQFGDAIDDRIAEILEELLEERDAGRPHQRLPRVLGTAGLLLLALTTSVLLRHNASAAWTIWPATATICLVIAWTNSTRRS
jgi:hypothetical protein